MKRFSRILAILLTACILCGMIVTAVFAEDTSAYQTTNLGYNYDFQDTEVGALSSIFPSGSNSANTYSTHVVAKGDGENKYFRFASINTVEATKAYRRDLHYGSYEASTGTKLNDYSYFTIDFDIAADGYAVPIGYEITSETSVTADNKATVVTDSETGITTITKTTKTTYYVRTEYYIFYPDAVPTEETLNNAISDQSVKFRTQLDAALKDIKDNHGTEVTTTSEDGMTVNVMKHQRVGSTVDGPALTASTVADDYVAALTAYDYASSMAAKRLSYPNGLAFNMDNRPQYTSGGDFQSGYNNVNVKFVYEDGEWYVYADGDTSPVKTEYKLSDKVGEWNHFTYAVKSVCTEAAETSKSTTGYTYGYSKASLFYNGYALVSGVTLLSSNAANAAYVNPRAINMQPGHYSDEYSMGLDNFVATYYPLVTKAYVLDENGAPTTTRDPMNDTHYVSGDGVVGIDDLFAGTVTSIAECEDVHYNSGYVSSAPNGYVIYNGSGEKIYVPSIINDIIENQLRDGQTIETTADLKGITPRDGASIDIIAAEGIEVTLSEAGAETHTLTKTEDGYRLECINQFKVPTVGSGKNLVYGSYAYNDFDGFSYNSKFVTGQGMDKHATFTTRTGVSGNSYWSISKNLSSTTVNNGNNGYYQWKLGEWASSATGFKNNDLIANYSYAVVDMEFGTDRYSAWVGYRVAITTKDSVTTYTIEKAYKTFTSFPSEEELLAAIDAQYDKLTAEIETYSAQLEAASINTEPYLEKISYMNARSSVTLAYMNGGTLYLGLRGSASAETNTTKNAQAWIYTIKHGDDWYLSSNSTYSADDYKLPSDIGQMTHITFVVSVSGTTATVKGYADGVYFTSSSFTQPVICLDDIRLQFPKDLKDEDIYGLVLDNLVCNYYEKGYTSGAANGIDDFVSGNCELWECVDTVWNGRYVSPAGSVKVDGGEASYLKPIFSEALKNLANGCNIVTERSLYGISLGDTVQSINVTAKNGAYIHLDDESALNFIIEEVSAEGNTIVYLVRRAGEEDAIHVTVVDVEGNTIGTTDILPNTIIDLSEFKGGVYDAENDIYKKVLAWCWDLDGDGTAYTEQIAESISVRDLPYIINKSVTAYPRYASISDASEGYAYVAYYTDNGVTRIVNDDDSPFLSIGNIGSTVTASPDGTTIKLTFEGDSIVLPKDAYYGYSGKSITFDLNGKTITRYNSSAYGAALIRIGEGATAIVTSSVPGARVFLISNRNSTVEGDGNNRIFGADGIVHTNKGVDSAHVEISNLEFNGGTMVKFDGLLTSDTAPAWENNTSITCKIDNVTGYIPNRSSYAAISTLCPDVVVEVTDSRFYVSDATYAFVHDYANDSAKGNYYRSETDLTIKNSEILCYSEGEKAAFGKFWHTMGTESSLYVENSKIIANLNGVGASKSSWGPGCEIATNKTSYFSAEKVASGVKYLINKGETDAAISLSFTRPAFTTDWSYADATNGKYIDSAYTDTVDITRSAAVTFVTFTEDKLPDYVGKVEWQDQNGGTVGGGYEFVGVKATAPVTLESLGLTDTVYDWYSKVYSWAGADGTLVVKAGENVFAPVMSTVTHIDGKQANMSLTTGMIFNLYIPLPDASIKAGSVYSPDSLGAIETVKVSGADMLKLSFASELDDFAPTAVSICFTTAEGEDLSYEVKVDALRYVTLLANSYECGTEEAQLAYEIVAYKKAVATYLATATGTTLDAYLSETELSAISAFEAVFTAHAEGCACTAGLYSDDEVGTETMPTDAYTAVGISGFAYLLNSDNNGLRINVGEGTVIKYASYDDLLGVAVMHDEALGNMKLIETETERYYVISGIGASDTTATVTITVEYGGETTTVTYSLAQYINSTNADVAKALYSYAKAAAAYKAITADEQAAQ